MNFFERAFFCYLFLCYRWLPFYFFKSWLNSFENKMILKYLSRMCIEPTKIPTIDAGLLTEREFAKVSNNYKNPVLIKGFMIDAPALHNWTPEYLNKQIDKNFKINCVSNSNNKVEIIPLTFSEFMKKKEDNIYINNNHTLLSHFTVLFNDIKERFLLLKTILYKIPDHIHIANLFIGYGKNKGSYLHCGGSGNFFTQIVGKKKWIFIDPKYSCLLKGRLSASGIHGQSRFDMLDQKIMIPPEIVYYLPRYEVILEPGDIVWNAPWWWHRVHNVSDNFNVGMAIRLNKVTKLNFKNNLLYTLSSSTYLFYNSFLIGLYERLFLKKGEHFRSSKEENKKSDVLYQIKQLSEKYPKSLTLKDIK